jgi:hypothetical protein
MIQWIPSAVSPREARFISRAPNHDPNIIFAENLAK